MKDQLVSPNSGICKIYSKTLIFPDKGKLHIFSYDNRVTGKYKKINRAGVHHFMQIMKEHKPSNSCFIILLYDNGYAF